MGDQELRDVLEGHLQFKEFIDGNLPDNVQIDYDLSKGGLTIGLDKFNEFITRLNYWNLEATDHNNEGMKEKIEKVGVWITLESDTNKVKAVLVALNSINEIVREGGGGPGGSPYVN